MNRTRRNLEPCGTPAAARRHNRHGEPLCDACRRAAALAHSIRTGSDPWRISPDSRPDGRPVRNGIPWQPYIYRGLGYDQLTGQEDIAS
jgi:hypothetical protein